MPNRIIRESSLTSPSLARLSDGAERLWWRLIVIADDYGRFEAHPQIVTGRCFPLVPDMTPIRTAKLLDELAKSGGIGFYLVNGRLYGYFINWWDYQRPARSKSKYPDPASDADNCEQLATIARSWKQLSPTVSGSGKREAGSEKREARSGKREAGDAQMLLASANNGPLTPKVLRDIWNRHIPSPACKALTRERLRHAMERIRGHPEFAFWQEVIAKIAITPFLRGQKPGKTWRADFDWLIRNDTNAIAVIEGKYDDDVGQTPRERADQLHREIEVYRAKRQSEDAQGDDPA